jgi:hypothetical protein
VTVRSADHQARPERLDDQQRKQLNALVGRCRQLLDADLGDLLEGRYGFRPDGSIELPAKLALDESGLAIRSELEAVLAHFAAEGETRRAGRERLLREAVFTHLNRLLAIRIAEELGLLPESIARGRDSTGFRDVVLDVAPLLGADDTGGYWTYLSLCGDELAADAPILFDPRNPLLALEPSPRVIDQLVEQLAPGYFGDSRSSLWSAADALGWAYQFFNTDDERREMRRGGAPSDWRELAVRNQFFTPEYVVHYLVHNTLGRRLADADPASPMIAELDWLLDPATEPGTPLALDEVKVLDPACGSGHFLLGAYDVLERAWAHQGVGAADAAARIVPALWGIDIDPRAVQVAAAAIVLRARRSCGRLASLPRPNVVCARGLPPIPEEVEAGLPQDHRHLLTELRAELDRAPVLGSLLKVEEVLGPRRLLGTAPGSKQGMAPLTVSDAAAGEVDAMRAEVLAAVQAAADQATATPAERLTAAEAGDALRFVQALSQRYDVVLMNPPFGEPAGGTRPYIKAAYPWIPTKDHNLLAAFVGRGLELCHEHGYVGAITSRAGLFLTTFQQWRTEVLLGHRLVTLADLGFGVMEDALVEAAAYVLGAGPARLAAEAPFLRLLRVPGPARGAALGEAIAAARAGTDDDRVFWVAPGAFAAVPGSPLAYWMSPSIRRMFTDLPPLEGHGAEVRQGLATGDDFRFVRAFWEVDPRRIARSREETFQGKRWVPFAKGGEYSPFWADIHLVVDFERDGERLRQFEGSRPQNMQYFFRPGVTWPRRTQAGFNPSLLPAGCAFADKGPGIFPVASVDSRALLGLLLSRPHVALLDTITTFGSYEVGAVARLPWPGRDRVAKLGPLTNVVERICRYKAMLDRSDETTRDFVGLTAQMGVAEESTRHDRERFAQSIDLLHHWADGEAGVLDALGLDAPALRFLDEEVGPLPGSDIAEIGELGSEPEAVPPRWIDDELEETARELQVTLGDAAATLVGDERRQQRLIREAAGRVFSYLVGCAFGRWDVRIGRDPSLAPPLGELIDPPPLCPRGTLIGADGLPVVDAPAGYPLVLPAHGLLLDEPGHRADVIAALDGAAAALVADPTALMHELSELLGREPREHIRRQFFREHLGRYSKSRRKAPIYWPLYIPSKAWGVWVHAPRLTRETLFAVEAAADQRLGSATTEIRRLEAAQLAGGGRSTSDLARRLEAERKLAEELRRFHREARRIAELGWAPDLDDGIVLCAAPLADLMPDWHTELAARRAELKRAEYPWATLHRHRGAL